MARKKKTENPKLLEAIKKNEETIKKSQKKMDDSFKSGWLNSLLCIVVIILGICLKNANYGVSLVRVIIGSCAIYVGIFALLAVSLAYYSQYIDAKDDYERAYKCNLENKQVSKGANVIVHVYFSTNRGNERDMDFYLDTTKGEKVELKNGLVIIDRFPEDENLRQHIYTNAYAIVEYL